MSISYSGLTNYGKATLPSVESWGTNMNLLRDPSRSITTRKIDKVGQTSSITDMIDDSANRSCEAILQYARGVNPFVSVSYSNNGNNGGQKSNGLNGMFNSGGRQSFLPYRVMRDGAFRPPVMRQENLLPLSRQPRVWTTAFTQPGFTDFSKRMKTCGDAVNTREVRAETLKVDVRPTAVYKIETPISEPFEVKYVIQNPVKVSGNSGLRTMDITEQNVKKPTKGVDDNMLYVYAKSNVGDNRNYIDNNEFNPDRYLQDGLSSAVDSNISAEYIQLTSIDEVLDLSGIKTKNAMNIKYDTQVSGTDQSNYIHKDLQRNRKMPEYNTQTNMGKNIHKKVSYENEIKLDRNLPLTHATSNNGGRGGIGSNNEIGSRKYRLNEKVKPGGFDGRGVLPMEGRTTQNLNQDSQQNLNKSNFNRKISQNFERYNN